MTVLGLVVRSLRQRPLSASLTALSVALGVMLVVAILIVRAEVEESFDRPGKGYSIVVGPPKSEPLSLVLNSVFHLGRSTGFMSYGSLAAIEQDPSARLVVPFAVGDAYKGYRVVATTGAVFDRHFPHPAAESAEGKFAEGRPFRFDPEALAEAIDLVRRRAAGNPEAEDHGSHHHDHEHPNEAVLGAEVARRLGIGVGARIEPTHGVEGEKEHSHEHAWTVVGILRPSGTPVDKVVFITLDSFYRIADHAGALIPETGEPGLSAALVFPKPQFHKANLLARLQKRSDLQVAEVATELRRLFEIVGGVQEVFLLVAILVVAIGVVSVMVAIYNTMNERRRELAILRAIGARATTLVSSIVGEAAFLAAGGAIAGLALGHALLWAAGPLIQARAQVAPDPARFHAGELQVLVLVTLAGALAGILPAAKAYRTDVAKNLAPLS